MVIAILQQVYAPTACQHHAGIVSGPKAIAKSVNRWYRAKTVVMEQLATVLAEITGAAKTLSLRKAAVTVTSKLTVATKKRSKRKA